MSTILLTQGAMVNHPFMKGCSEAFLNRLDGLATEITFKKDDILIREGDYADRFYLILDGEVALETSSNGGPTCILQILKAGEALGWSWLFPPFEWHFTGRAIKAGRAIELNAASLLIRAEEDPAFGYELMKRISKQVIERLQATRRKLLEEHCRHEGSD